MKPIQVFVCVVSFSLAGILLVPYSGMCYLRVEGSGCVVCHDTGTLHTIHSANYCVDCHNAEPGPGTVNSSRCLECHISIDAQVCDLVEIHNPYVSDCVNCHVQCQSVSDTFCKGNFDYDKDVDGSDASLFKQHFGRSALSAPCLPDGPAPVGKTWQTISYATGDDGDLEKGVAWPSPRFTDNGDGTITDNLTGLIWLKNANCFGIQQWGTALWSCNSLNSGECGITDGSIAGDWRLPHVKELQSLIDFHWIEPALPSGHPFGNVQYDLYWSSTTCAYPGGNEAWGVDMSDGYGVGGDKGNYRYVWPVRGGH